jgi:hypothetical protein
VSLFQYRARTEYGRLFQTVATKDWRGDAGDGVPVHERLGALLQRTRQLQALIWKRFLNSIVVGMSIPDFHKNAFQ